METMKNGLAGIKFPISKQNIQIYLEQNKSKIKDADSVTIAIGKLPPKEYANIQEIEKELLK